MDATAELSKIEAAEDEASYECVKRALPVISTHEVLGGSARTPGGWDWGVPNVEFAETHLYFMEREGERQAGMQGGRQGEGEPGIRLSTLGLPPHRLLPALALPL